MNEYTPGSVWMDSDNDLWAVVDDGRLVLIVCKEIPVTPEDSTLSIDSHAQAEYYGPLVQVFDGNVN